MRADTPLDLARRLGEALRDRGIIVELDVLRAILETLYFASLRTEEAEGVRCQVVYLDPEDPDPDPPERIVQDRWQVTALRSPISLTVANLVKVAQATDARASSFAVYPDSGGDVVIWALVDQGNRIYDFINFESDSGQQPPGVFIASIEGLAHLRAAIGYRTIAELRIDRIVQETIDILAQGPVRDALQPGLDAYESRVRAVVGDEIFDRRGHWTSSLIRYWIETLCRLVLRGRRYGHGGGVSDHFRRLAVRARHQVRARIRPLTRGA